jgi:5-methyltetrahydrofolate--homocysteine methyltransferase
MEILNQISESLQKGDDKTVGELTQQAIDAGVSAAEILNDGLLAAMDVVGRKFGANEIFLPEVLLAARAMNAGMDLIKPLLVADDVPSLGKVVIGTVKGDLHDIGKNLVGIMLKGAGFDVIDLGADVAADAFVDTAEAEGASVVGLSALLTTTMSGMKEVVELVKSKGLEGQVKVIVGGAPVSQDYADSIGADAYGYDAANAVGLVKGLTGVA